MTARSTQESVPPRRRETLTGYAGRGLIWTGLLILGFVAYQLWGTGIATAKFQRELAAELDSVADDTTVTTTTTETTTETTTLPDFSTVTSTPGEALGRIISDKMGLNAVFVHGVRHSNLKKGPGWFPETARVGGAGNAALAGHRTSYGAPFANIDRLEPGDKITVELPQGTFEYFVTNTVIVGPNDTYVLRTTDWTRSTLTLVSCHPKYSSKRRIIVFAEQQTRFPPRDVATTPPPADTIVEEGLADDALRTGWFHDPAGTLPTLSWSAVAIVVWLATRRLSQRMNTFGRVAVLVVGFVVLWLPMFFVYENLSRLLPVDV